MAKKSIEKETNKKNGVDLLYRTLNSRDMIKAGANRFGKYGDEYTHIRKVRQFVSDHWHIIEIEIVGESDERYKTYIYAVEHKGNTWFHMSSSKIVFEELEDDGKTNELMKGE